MATKVAKNTNSEAKEARTVIADTGPHRSDLGQRIAAPLALWGLACACYRAYYAAGGQFGVIGNPTSATQSRMVNATWAVIILVAAILPLNEPWFMIEGLLWAALGVALVRALRRRAWAVSALAVMLTVVGVLSGLGTIASFRLG